MIAASFHLFKRLPIRVNLGAICIFAALALVPIIGSALNNGYLVSLFTRVIIFSIAAIALTFLIGFAGLISFGHAAFMGIGAYAVGILSKHGVTDALFSVPVAIIASGLFAWITGLVCLRTRGVYFIMITLAFGQMAFFTATSLAPYGGDDGLTIHVRSTLVGFPFIASDLALYWVSLGCLLTVFLGCRLMVRSRFGRVLFAARDNHIRTITLGYDVHRFQLTAYVIAGTIAGLSGFLLANATNFVSPAYMSWQRSGDLLIMCILGGTGSLTGALVGTGTYLLLEEWLAGLTEHWKMLFGPLLVAVVIFAPGGLIAIGSWFKSGRSRG